MAASCTDCGSEIRNNNRSGLCQYCRRVRCCKSCGKIKEDPQKFRCDRCNVKAHFGDGRKQYIVRPCPPEWLEERIERYRKLAEQELPLS